MSLSQVHCTLSSLSQIMDEIMTAGKAIRRLNRERPKRHKLQQQQQRRVSSDLMEIKTTKAVCKRSVFLPLTAIGQSYCHLPLVVSHLATYCYWSVLLPLTASGQSSCHLLLLVSLTETYCQWSVLPLTAIGQCSCHLLVVVSLLVTYCHWSVFLSLTDPKRSKCII